MGANGDPNKGAMDKSGANKAAIDAINAGRETLADHVAQLDAGEHRVGGAE